MITKTRKAVESFSQIVASAEKICNNKTQYFPEAASVGDYWRQGDIYVTLLENVPDNTAVDSNPSLQLAPGNTQGSRHLLDSLSNVTIYKLDNATVLDGPILKTDEQKTITHPEHGDVVIPKGCYSITYQRAYADELRRIAD